MNTALDVLPLVLVASGPLCPRVLAAAGLKFRQVEPTAGEPVRLSGCVGPVQQAEALAYFHARRIAEREKPCRVLAVSTRVVLGDRLFGAPFGRLEAAEMLRAISGRRHAVVSGVAIVQPGHRLIASEVTHVTMRAIPELVIARYLASGDWLGIAGAYASPEMAGRFVAGQEGSFSNLLGMPVELVTRMLAELREHPEPHCALRILAV